MILKLPNLEGNFIVWIPRRNKTE